jgi:hypothetical protein
VPNGDEASDQSGAILQTPGTSSKRSYTEVNARKPAFPNAPHDPPVAKQHDHDDPASHYTISTAVLTGNLLSSDAALQQPGRCSLVRPCHGEPVW